MTTFRSSTSRLALAAVAAALSLGACNRATRSAPAESTGLAAADTSGQPVSAPPIAALPLATATPVAASLAPATLPRGRAIRVASRSRAERYRYIDRAAEYNRGFANTPPDYTVDYQGTRPWVWRANNGAYRVVEQLPQGQRDYYYQAGSDRPFFVSDPQGGYAYDNGDLVVAYSPDGAALDYAYAAGRTDAAAAYYDRAQALYRAAQYDRRQAAYAADWQARRADDAAWQAAYDNARAHDAEWQAWHDRHAGDERRQWNDERNRRVAYAAAIAAGVGAAAVIATRGHDDRNDGGLRQGSPGYRTNGIPAGQVALIPQQAALDGQRRRAAISAQRAAADAHTSAQADSASQAQRVAAARQQAHVTAEAQRVAAAITAERARNAAKTHQAAKQAAHSAAIAQADITARTRREAVDAAARQQAKLAHEAQHVGAAADAAKARDAATTADAVKRQAGDAARAGAAARQQAHAAVEAQLIAGQMNAAKTRDAAKAAAAAERAKGRDAQRQQAQAGAKAHKAAADKAKGDKGKPDDQPK